MGLYERIKEVASEKGTSVNRIEKDLGLPRSSISKYNSNVPSIAKVKIIADYLNVPVYYLIDGKDRLKDLYINGLIELDEYKSDREQLESELAALTAYKPRTGPDMDSLKDLLSTDFETLYGTFSAQERRFFWRSIIKEIRFSKDRQYEIIFLD